MEFADGNAGKKIHQQSYDDAMSFGAWRLIVDDVVKELFFQESLELCGFVASLSYIPCVVWCRNEA